MIQLYAFSRHTQIGRIASIRQAIGRGIFGRAGLLGGGTGVAGAAVSTTNINTSAAGPTLASIIGTVGKWLFTTPLGWVAGATIGIEHWFIKYIKHIKLQKRLAKPMKHGHKAIVI
mgnify:CR=1 FL=1